MLPKEKSILYYYFQNQDIKYRCNIIIKSTVPIHGPSIVPIIAFIAIFPGLVSSLVP